MTDEPETPSKRKPRQPSKGGEADPAQYERFLEAARELGCDEDAPRLDEVVRRLARMPDRRADRLGKRKGTKP